jgi:hypothetical protein
LPLTLVRFVDLSFSGTGGFFGLTHGLSRPPRRAEKFLAREARGFFGTLSGLFGKIRGNGRRTLRFPLIFAV